MPSRQTPGLKPGLFPALLLGAVLAGPPAIAADHRDGPLVLTDPAADINDVFAWMSPDASKVNLVMSVFPFAGDDAQFSDAVNYNFHTSSVEAFLDPAGPEVNIQCWFNAAQQIHCSLGDISVSGHASSTTGIESAGGEMRVFAGLRNDPFFFNFTGFRATAEIVTGAAASLDFDGNGCPVLDDATSTALVTQLASGSDGAPASDNFAGGNVLAIVLSVDKSLLTENGSIVSVWGSTEQRIR